MRAGNKPYYPLINTHRLIAVFLVILVFSPFFSHKAQASLANASYTPPGLKNGLVGWWTFDGNKMVSNVTDSSGSGNTGYLQNFGATSTAVVPGKVGQGLKFDGVDDRITTGSDFINTNALTISAWIKPRSFGGSGVGRIVSNSRAEFFITGNLARFTSDAGTTEVASAASSIPLNKWTFVTATRDSTGALGNIYINGVLSGTANQNSGTPVAGTSNVGIGFRGASTNYFFDGLLDDIRIYNRALSATEIKQLYNMGSAKVNVSSPTISDGLISHLTFDGNNLVQRVTDSSGFGNNGYLTNFGATSSVVTAGKIGQAITTDGVNDQITITDSSSINFTSSDFTFAFWMKFTSANSGGMFMHKTNSTDVASSAGFYMNNPGSNTIGFKTFQSGASQFIRNSNPRFETGKWQHIAFTREGTVGTIYINSVAATGYYNRDSIVDPVSSSGYNLRIFGGTNNYYAIKGSIDDYRIYNRALSASEIKRLYDFGQPKFNTSATGISNGLIGWWTFDGKDLINNVVDSSGKGNTGYFKMGTQGNTATTSAVIPGKIGQGLRFDGRDDRVETSSDFIGTSALTVTAWILPTDLNAGAPRVIDNTKTRLWLTTSDRFAFSSDGASSVVSSSLVPVPINGQWQFVAATRTASGVTNLYANGVLSGAADRDSGTPTAGSVVNIGAISGSPTSNPFKGGIDNVRVYNRVLSASEIKQLYNMGR